MSRVFGPLHEFRPKVLPVLTNAFGMLKISRIIVNFEGEAKKKQAVGYRGYSMKELE